MTVTNKSQKAPLRALKPRGVHLSSLEDALLSLSDRDEVLRFLNDVCTPGEIEALRQRWALAQMLNAEMPQREAAKRASASIATVTRVARCLQHERHHGYRIVLDRLNPKGRS